MITPEIVATPYGRTGATTLITVSHDSSGPDIFPATFTEIINATDYDSSGFWLHFRGNGATSTYQCKLYSGAESFETEFLHVVGPSISTQDTHFFVPIAIPAGTRITAKTASAGGFQTAVVGITLIRGTIGNSKQVSRGVVVGLTSGEMLSIDCGTTANTKSDWLEIISATSHPVKGFSFIIAGDISSTTTTLYYTDIGIGPISNVLEIITNWPTIFQGFNPEARIFGPIWTPIPEGSRIVARAQCNITGAASRVPRVALILWE